MRTEALKEAQKRHREGIIQFNLSFSPSERELYTKARDKAEEEGISLNALIKSALEKMLQ